MSSTPSQPGLSEPFEVPDLFKQEVYAVLREWLIEANRISFDQGGTPWDCLGKALDNLTKEGDGADPGRGADLASR
jgi:hypothetical protein